MLELGTKWPAARISGPPVTVVQALEYIRRTDQAFMGYGFTNDREFERGLRGLLGLPEEKYGRDHNWRVEEAYTQAFGASFEHVELNHLNSRWVASSYIGGPDGPVHPGGRVELARNFGKWPDLREIHTDLDRVAAAFPWLQLKLALWDGYSNEDEDVTAGPPTHTWHLRGDGTWAAVAPEAVVLPTTATDPVAAFMVNFNKPGRETTWTVADIKALWGKEIATARAAGAAAVAALNGLPAPQQKLEA